MLLLKPGNVQFLGTNNSRLLIVLFIISYPSSFKSSMARIFRGRCGGILLDRSPTTSDVGEVENTDSYVEVSSIFLFYTSLNVKLCCNESLYLGKI